MENCKIDIYINLIDRLLASGHSFALYRLPGQAEVRLVLQYGAARPLRADEVEPRGFLLAPFDESVLRPTLLIEAEAEAVGWEAIARLTEALPPGGEAVLDALPVAHRTSRYAQFFEETKLRILQGEMEKLVAADKRIETGQAHLLGREARVFLQAVERCPEAMVYLLYTPASGRWMGITPEVLLESEADGKQLHTMALAGTKRDTEEPWDLKNRVEHEAVVHYLEDKLSGMGLQPEKGPTHTQRAGALLHLCTDFRFSTDGRCTTMALLRALHPTPAVCGVPKEVALKHILQGEQTDRNYYSGYLGPVGMAEGTHVYVNLRCAQIRQSATLYYAGGGLNRYSELETERAEIDHKMNTLMEMAKIN